TMYSTFGNSRLPVMSVVSSSMRSVPFCPLAFAAVAPLRSAEVAGVAGATAAGGAPPDRGALAVGAAGAVERGRGGGGAAAGGGGVGAGGGVEVLTPGSRSSGRGIPRGAGVAGAVVGDAGGGACCATAKAPGSAHSATAKNREVVRRSRFGNMNCMNQPP